MEVLATQNMAAAQLPIALAVHGHSPTSAEYSFGINQSARNSFLYKTGACVNFLMEQSIYSIFSYKN